MLRSIQAVAFVAAVIALAALIGIVWHDQRGLVVRLEGLDSQLTRLAEETEAAATEAAIAATRRPAPKQPRRTTASIRGVVYRGDRDTPASDVSVTLHGANNEFERELRTDSRGAFQSGELPPDRYWVSVTPENSAGETGERSASFRFRSKDYDLYHGGSEAMVEIDVTQLDVELQVRFDPPLLREIPLGENLVAELQARLMFYPRPPEMAATGHSGVLVARNEDSYVLGSVWRSWSGKELELVRMMVEGQSPQIRGKELEEMVASLPDEFPPLSVEMPKGRFKVSLDVEAKIDSQALAPRELRGASVPFHGMVSRPLLLDSASAELEFPGPGRYVLEIRGLSEDSLRAPVDTRSNEEIGFNIRARRPLAAVGLRVVSPDVITFHLRPAD